jgi:hypothetical protein
VLADQGKKTWMAGTSPAMTETELPPNRKAARDYRAALGY